MDARGQRRGYRRPKSGSNWPLWVLLAVFGVGLIAFFATSGGKTKRRRARPAVSHQPDVQCERLPVGGCYGLSRDTPLCEGSGLAFARHESAKRIILPRGTQIGIIHARWVEKVRWYHVQAVASDGKTDLGSGWISSTALKGQHLKPLR